MKKKLMSMILVLTMAMALFAGCNHLEPATMDGSDATSTSVSAEDVGEAVEEDVDDTNEAELTSAKEVVSMIEEDGYFFLESASDSEYALTISGEDEKVVVRAEKKSDGLDQLFYLKKTGDDTFTIQSAKNDFFVRFDEGADKCTDVYLSDDATDESNINWTAAPFGDSEEVFVITNAGVGIRLTAFGGKMTHMKWRPIPVAKEDAKVLVETAVEQEENKDDQDEKVAEDAEETKEEKKAEDNASAETPQGSQNGSSGGSGGSGNGNNSGSSGGSQQPAAHTHNWVQKTSTVHHDEVGHWETVVVQEAWDEPIYERHNYSVCNSCGEIISGAYSEHSRAKGCLGGFSSGSDYYQVGTTHHDAITEKRWVVDSAAWDETIVTGYVCSSCGATK